eukprot:c24348_g1_i1 orf=426-1721(+)
MTASFLFLISGNKSFRRQNSSECRKTCHTGLRLTSLSLCLAVATLFFLLSSFVTGPLHYMHSEIGEVTPLFYLYEAADRFIQNGISNGPLNGCDIFTGRWVYDQSYPLYNASACPFAETGFRCQENGRSDFGYLRWRWQPFGCSIPRFNAQDIRRRLQGLRVAFVGDSMGRTQWESFVCFLMADISDKGSVYEVNGKTVTKLRSYLGVHFRAFNFTIEYYRSPYLVRQGAPPKHAPNRVQLTLILDKIESSAVKWQQADVLVFNTGHWWTQPKTFGRGCYFQVGEKLKLGMKIETAYHLALNTWATWVKTKIDHNRTQVFFRSFEPAHWEGSWRDRMCPVETAPVLNSTYTEDFPHLPVLQQVIESMGVPVTILNITTLSSYRRDSHVANWTDDPNAIDCGHWCLPGVPDIWNELLYASLLQKGKGSWIQQ